MTVFCPASEVYTALDGGRVGCANCKETRDTKDEIIVHAATVHGIRPARDLKAEGKP